MQQPEVSSSEHEWVRLEGTEAVIGITDFAQESLGVVFVELPAAGSDVTAGKPFGWSRATRASDLAPLSDGWSPSTRSSPARPKRSITSRTARAG
jgi:glycine cleavage system H lipoate-binding protein